MADKHAISLGLTFTIFSLFLLSPAFAETSYFIGDFLIKIKVPEEDVVSYELTFSGDAEHPNIHVKNSTLKSSGILNQSDFIQVLNGEFHHLVFTVPLTTPFWGTIVYEGRIIEMNGTARQLDVIVELPYSFDPEKDDTKKYIYYISYSTFPNASIISESPIILQYSGKNITQNRFFADIYYYAFPKKSYLTFKQVDEINYPSPELLETPTFVNRQKDKIIQACVIYDEKTRAPKEIFFDEPNTEGCNKKGGEPHLLDPSKTFTPFPKRPQILNYADLVTDCGYSEWEKVGYPFDCKILNYTRELSTYISQNQTFINLDFTYDLIVDSPNYELDINNSEICIAPKTIFLKNIYGTVFWKDLKLEDTDFEATVPEELCDTFIFAENYKTTFTTNQEVVSLDYYHRTRYPKSDKLNFAKIEGDGYTSSSKFILEAPATTYKIKYKLTFKRSLFPDQLFYYLSIPLFILFGFFHADKVYFARALKRRKLIDAIIKFLKIYIFTYLAWVVYKDIPYSSLFLFTLTPLIASPIGLILFKIFRTLRKTIKK